MKRNAQFAFRVFEYTLDTRCPDDPACATYSDAVKDLHGFCLHQLQRLAMRFPDYLIVSNWGCSQIISCTYLSRLSSMKWRRGLTHFANPLWMSRLVFDTPRFCLLSRQYNESKLQFESANSSYRRHRATIVDEQPREARLELFLQPLILQWQSNNLGRSLSSFDGFCELVGLGGIQHYISVRRLHQVREWSSHPLDEEGKLLQLHMQTALEVFAALLIFARSNTYKAQRVPLRATKTLLSVSVERLEPCSPPHNMACELWQKKLPLILPNLLHFIRHVLAIAYPTGL